MRTRQDADALGGHGARVAEHVGVADAPVQLDLSWYGS